MVGGQFRSRSQHGLSKIPDTTIRPAFHGLRPTGRPRVPPIPARGPARGRQQGDNETDAHPDGNRREIEVN